MSDADPTPRFKNSEAKLRANRRWNAKNREHKREYDRRYTEANPGRSNTPTNPEHRDFILAAKDRPCVDCGQQLEPKRMHFDHVRGEKLFDLAGSAARRKLDSIKAEIAKCEVRCVECHGRRHRQEQLAS